MTLRPDNLISNDEARRLSLISGQPQVSTGSDQVVNRRSSLKPPAPSHDSRRPSIDTILARVGFKGELGPEDQISAGLADRIVAPGAITTASGTPFAGRSTKHGLRWCDGGAVQR